MGVNVSLYKVKSFAISAAITGFAGVLFAHKLSFISPEMFTLQLSIEFIIVILIGGTFSLHGAVLGAIFLVMIDPFLTYLKDDMPGIIAGDRRDVRRRQGDARRTSRATSPPLPPPTA